MDELYLRQHSDAAIGPRNYEPFGAELLVTSIFYTIQGEGPLAGSPAVFVRLAGCNRGDKTAYGCQFCDTDFRFANGKPMSVEAIYERVTELRRLKVAGPVASEEFLVVITGGEPMMQDNVWYLCKHLMDQNIRVQIESNGDRLAHMFHHEPLIGLLLVVSPKIQAKKEGYGQIRHEVMSRANCFKFLVDAREDSPYHRIPDFILNGDYRLRTMISPLTVYAREVRQGEVPSIWSEGLLNVEATKANALYAAELAMRHGLRVSLQTHLFLAMP